MFRSKVNVTPSGTLRGLIVTDDDYVPISATPLKSEGCRDGKEEAKTIVPLKCGGDKLVSAYMMKRSPQVRRFKRTKSKAKDQVFTGLDKMPSMGAPPISPNQIYNFTGVRRSPGFMTSSVTLEVQANFFATLADLASGAGYQAVFDQYRFVGIEVWLIPRLSNNSAAINTGLIGSAIDYDDSSATSLTNLSEYVSYMEGPGYDGHYRSFVPAAVITVDGVEANVVQEAWIDCTFGAVVHRGVKFAVTANDEVLNWDLIARYHLQFRNVR